MKSSTTRACALAAAIRRARALEEGYSLGRLTFKQAKQVKQLKTVRLALAGAHRHIELAGQLRDPSLQFGDPFQPIPASGTHRIIHTGMVSAGERTSSDLPVGGPNNYGFKNPHFSFTGSDNAIFAPMWFLLPTDPTQ
jgi:hypothetical protein